MVQKTPVWNKSLLLHVMVILTFGLVGYSTKTGNGTDGQIEGAIKRRLEMDTRINSELMGVQVEKGHAKLFGTVETLEEKSLANTIASTVVGLQSVNNTIRVTPEVSQDREIQNKILQLIDIAGFLTKDKLTKDHITVRTTDGVVTLEGTVLKQKNKNRLSHLALSVKGVKKVENLIQVVNSKRPDQAIHNDVVLYLLWSPIFNVDEFKVEVKNGMVSLQGSVDHLVHKNVLIIDLENIRGVKGVEVGEVVPKPFEAFPKQSTEKS